MSERRIVLLKSPPEMLAAMNDLEAKVKASATAAGITDGFLHLLKLRASQINQCSYCVRLHTRDALEAGESSDRISLIAAWRESDYFNDKERASLALAEAITLIADGQVAKEVYEFATAVMSDEEVAAVEWIAVSINTWNRIAIASRTPVKPS
jgi:AhpD family alkylhydroperoxidase